MENLFNKLNSIDVNEKVEKKGKFNYLSWAWAWAEVKKLCPTATYRILRFGEENLPYQKLEDMGYMVYTEVTIDELTHLMWLPVMDFKNQAVKTPNAMDINKTIMRCLTKNLAMHGLGLYIYAGEDLPEDTEEKQNNNEIHQENATNSKALHELISFTKAKKIDPIEVTDTIQKMFKKNNSTELDEGQLTAVLIALRERYGSK